MTDMLVVMALGLLVMAGGVVLLARLGSGSLSRARRPQPLTAVNHGGGDVVMVDTTSDAGCGDAGGANGGGGGCD